jgi:NAD(P)-dependent dehydrogenase (short-subunit alcohol dehydrogenase family)
MKNPANAGRSRVSVVITGASRGIGGELARQLAARGAQLVLAARIVRGIERREREVVMTARGKIGLWLRLIAPGLVDRIARCAVEQGR